jgi:succinate dehydrogenase / fumarate reductase iron-sulfur subunit
MDGMSTAHLKVFRGSPGRPGGLVDFDVPVEEGMVVLDALHWIQGHVAPDLAVRWNCKAAKCGSCSAEVNGRPSLTCKTRLADFDLAEPISVEPMRSFPLIRDLVTDVSWNYEVNKTIAPFTPPNVPQSRWRWQQEDIERVQEFRKCIECFLCQDVCHVLRNHETERPFMGPRYLVRAAGLEMHPIDQADRLSYLKDEGNIGYCNITKCCTEVCPEHIKITDNAIIPLKERVADRYYDPFQVAWRKLTGRGADTPSRQPLPVLPAGAAELPRAAEAPRASEAPPAAESATASAERPVPGITDLAAAKPRVRARSGAPKPETATPPRRRSTSERRTSSGARKDGAP